MADTTTVRLDSSTHAELKRIARERHTTMADALARAVRLLRQEEMGADLALPSEDTEDAWLDADLG